MASPLSLSLPTVFSTVPFKVRRRAHRQQLSFISKSLPPLFIARTKFNGDGSVGSSVVDEKKVEAMNRSPHPDKEKYMDVKGEVDSMSSNGAAFTKSEALTFKDPRWVGGTWDLMQFQKGVGTDWSGVIDAEARRRRWLQDNPEATSTAEPIVFETSIVPWWAWAERYHLPEASGRAAMIGFFMTYFVDCLTGLGLFDQTGNNFCKLLLFASVVGVILNRKNEDIANLKELIEGTVFYDKQWRATWQEGDK